MLRHVEKHSSTEVGRCVKLIVRADPLRRGDRDIISGSDAWTSRHVPQVDDVREERGSCRKRLITVMMIVIVMALPLLSICTAEIGRQEILLPRHRRIRAARKPRARRVVVGERAVCIRLRGRPEKVVFQVRDCWVGQEQQKLNGDTASLRNELVSEKAARTVYVAHYVSADGRPGAHHYDTRGASVDAELESLTSGRHACARAGCDLPLLRRRERTAEVEESTRAGSPVGGDWGRRGDAQAKRGNAQTRHPERRVEGPACGGVTPQRMRIQVFCVSRLLFFIRETTGSRHTHAHNPRKRDRWGRGRGVGCGMTVPYLRSLALRREEPLLNLARRFCGGHAGTTLPGFQKK